MLQNGQSQFCTTALARGTHVITANYSGDANYNPNPGLTISQVVQ
jgi:hypothetical protein